MRTTLLGLSVPLLLFAAAFATVIPEASAQDAEYFEISGRVIDDSDEPLAGVRVNAYTYPESGDERYAYSSSLYRGADAITDDEGRYTLKLAAGRGYINVYYDEWRIGDGRELVVDGDDDDVDFTLKAPPPKTAIIQGTVVDAEGDPVEDATVTLGYGCCYAYPAETMPSPQPVEDMPDAVAEDSSDNATYVGDGYGAGDDGSAKMYADSRIAPPYYDDYATATTDEDGEFTFKAYGGPRQITAWAKGFAQTTMQVEAVDGETVQVEVELEKVPARNAILEGRVFDGDTGLPLANAHVSVRSLEWGRYAEATTDKEGRYRIQTVPGWQEITVNFWDYGGEPIPLAAEGDVAISKPVVMSTPRYFPLSLLIDLDSGDNEQDLELDPKPKPTIALVGYVVDPDAKKGVPDARVNVWNHETGDWGEAVTDKTGSFRILVREGHYSASAWKDGYLGGTQTFVVDDDAAQRLDLLLPKGTQKWAPCYDDADCGGPIMYDAVAAKSAEGYAGSGGTSPPMTATTLDAREGDDAGTGAVATDNAAPAPEAQRTGAASFPGEGGGLPEYDPARADEVPMSSAQTGPSEIPGLGLLALVAAAGVLALAMRRRG